VESGIPERIELRVVTPAGELLRQPVDELIAPGEEGYFGVRPGHTPLLASLGLGELSYRSGSSWERLTCFSGFCEVLPDRVTILADVGERPGEIDVARAEASKAAALEKMKTSVRESEHAEAHAEYERALTRLSVARSRRGPAGS
jgi:F-type H+-transporting ATPase subunit epsilon